VPYDGSVHVPLLIRCPGIVSRTDNRLVASTDLAPTLARVAGVELGWSVDGRVLQGGWNREWLLLEFWSSDQDRGVLSFNGVRTRHETYVEYANGKAVLWDRRVDHEESDHLPDVDAAQWAAWLTALRDCAGTTCGNAEGAS
jgi:N-acetylglucosamine-6-sulfatase